MRDEANVETRVEISLPEKPQASETIDEITGKKTTVTVEDLYDVDDQGNIVKDESGNPVVVGYLTTTVVAGADGVQVSSSKTSVWGAKTTVITPLVTTTTEDQTVTTTSTILVTKATTVNGQYIEMADMAGGIHCGVWGQMGAVQEGDGHGKEETNNFTPTVTEPAVGKTDTSTDLYHRADATYQIYKVTADSLNVRPGAGSDSGSPVRALKKDDIVIVVETKAVNGATWGRIGTGEWISLGYVGTPPAGTKPKADQGQFLYLGEYGLESAIRVNGEGSTTGTWQPHQFKIYDSQGNAYYVYCADFEVSPVKGTDYGKTDVMDADYWVKGDGAANTEIAKHIETIALNGYWGTGTGAGSLNAVKEMMKKAIDEGKIGGIQKSDVDRLLTDGMALTATQAAIWSYATSGGKINTKNPFGKYNSDGAMVQNGFTEKEKEVAMALYHYLRGLERSNEERSKEEEINEKNITQTSITVKSLATGEDGKPIVNDNTDPHNTAYSYNTDVSFILDVEPSQINDDLIVRVLDSNTGKVIATRRLAGDDSKTNYGKIVGNNGNYTIENLVLAEGVKITLNLNGIQKIGRAHV